MPPTRLPEPFEIKRSDEMIKEDKKIYEAEKKAGSRTAFNV